MGCARLPLCINYICQLQAAGFAVVVIRWIHPSDPEEVRCAQMVQLSPQNRVDRVSVRAPTLHGKGATYVCRNERKKEACLAALRKWKFSLATNDIRMGRKVLRCTHEGYTYAIKWLWMLRLHAILVALSLMQGGQVDK